MSPEVSKIAFLGNYLPRRCGIATFTTDLCDAIAGVAPEASLSVVAMNDTPEGYRYPPRVRFQIAQNKLLEYGNAADFLNITNFEVACVQHEFGIFGGAAGGHVLSLMRELRVPVVTTLHTVLREPDPAQKSVMDDIIKLSDRVVVMSEKALHFMKEIYHAPEEKLAFIHHGVADMPFVDPSYYKDLFGVEGRRVLMTFGFISPNKGIEYAINALPEVVKKHPDIVYMVVGATHPAVVRHRGEEYRFFLQGLVRSLGLSDHVIFHDRFVEFEELERFLGSADICITPYLTESQIVSGVLSLCIGAGKATISTPYWYASEMLGKERGVIVPFRDSRQLSLSLIDLLDNDVRRHAMRKRAYLFGRKMVWPEVARKHLQVFNEALHEKRRAPRKVVASGRKAFEPAINFSHLRRLTDHTGILQHAKFTIPDRSHGYCTDDNARALVVAVRAAHILGEEAKEISDLAAVYLSFLDYALIEETGRFHNFMGYDRRWLDSVGSEDSQGRGLWGIGTAASYAGEPGTVGVATRLFNTALDAARRLVSPRAEALSLVGVHEYLRRFGGDMAAQRTREELATRLFGRFKKHGRRDWPWPEDTLNYENARLPQALLLSGQWMHRSDMIEMGLEALSFLIKVQKSPEGHFEPVGYKGWYKRGGTKARFDQQPIEAAATIDACVGAWRVTRDERWLDEAKICYDWFLGVNDLGASIYDHYSGGCKDGLQADGVNQNEGAESTLSWLMALLSMEEVKFEVDYQKKAQDKADAVTAGAGGG